MTSIVKNLTIVTPLAQVNTDEANANVTYIGRTKKAGALPSEPVWQIIRQAKIGAVTYETAAGDRGFDQIWDDRVSLFPPVPYINEYSLAFNGINKYVSVPNNASLNFGLAGQCSFSLWVNTSDTGAFRLIAKTGAGTQGYQIHKLASELIEVEFRGSGGVGDRDRVTTTTALPIDFGIWHNIVVTRSGVDAAGINVYIDGILSPKNINNNTLITTTDSIGSLSIGASSGGGNYYSGLLDEVCVWNVELDQDNITALYNGGIPIDPKSDSALYVNSANLISYWQFTADDRANLPVIADQVGVNQGTGVNFVAGNFFTEVP